MNNHHFKNEKKMLNLYVKEGTAIQAFHIFDLALPALGISNPERPEQQNLLL
jgi:hypothetical protein